MKVVKTEAASVLARSPTSASFLKRGLAKRLPESQHLAGRLIEDFAHTDRNARTALTLSTGTA